MLGTNKPPPSIPPSEIPPPSIDFYPRSCMIGILLILAVGLAVCLGGCKTFQFLADNPEQLKAVQDGIKAGGTLLAPATGGISAWVSHAIAFALPSLIAMQQGWKARRRGQAIKHIDDFEKSKPAAEQVPAGVHRKTVRGITG